MGKNRRDFLKQASVLAVTPTLLTEEMQVKKNNQFVHHVFFYLNDNTSANRAKLIEGLRKLSFIKHIKAYNIGVPAPSNRDVVVQDYSVSLLLMFKDADAEKKYQVDPIHVKFVEEYKNLWSKVVVYDTNPVIF